MDRILDCKVCGKRFVALRKDATTCSARCRKKLSRTMAVVTDDVTVPEPIVEDLPVRQGWLPLAAVPLPPEPPAPPPKVMVPTAVDPMLGRLEDFVRCESPEAATHWDVRAWHR